MMGGLEKRFHTLLGAMASGEAPSARKKTPGNPASGGEPPHLVTVVKLPQMLQKMLTADVDVSAVDPAL
jgi:hypothetical protein